MTEYESDPQRRPADAGPQPSPHPVEPPRVDQGPADPVRPGSGVPTTGAPTPSYGPPSATPGGPPTSGVPGGPGYGAGTPGGGPASGAAPTSGVPGGPGYGAGGPGSQPTSGYGPGPQPTSGYGSGGQDASGSQAAGSGGHPYPTSGPAAGGYPASPWSRGQQGTWSGQPGPYGTQQPGYGPSGYPGQPGAQYPQPGQSLPPWGVHAGPQPPQRSGRAGKYVLAGVLVLGLMFGSGVTGGALALGLGGDLGSRTFSAAPVINSADLPKIAAQVQPSVVSIATDNGEGSGVILTAGGFVLTNNHVVASGSADSVRVIFADGRNAAARVVGTDPKTDLAVVEVRGVSGLKPATLGDSDAMQVGDQVLALGSPLGLQGSVTAGIISARDRTIRAGSQQDPQQGASSIAGLLQTDAPINPGNSGGALVNTRGEVIGINTAIATAGQSTGNIGVGFAIPSNKAKDVAEKLQRGEKVSHPSLGVSVAQSPNGGALVSSVLPGSAAEQAGLRQGDVVTRFGDTTVNDSSDLVGAVQARKVGDRVEVRYQRDGTENTVTVTLTEG